MNRRLVMARHFSFGYSCHSDFDEYIFLVDENSKIPNWYIEKMKLKLKKYFPNVSFVRKSEIEIFSHDLVLDFDSYDEINVSQGKLNQAYQNRLFDRLPFSCPDGFSSFRKKVETILPKYFKEVIPPFDDATIFYLDKYFSSSHPKSYFETRNKMIGEHYSAKFSDLLWSETEIVDKNITTKP